MGAQHIFLNFVREKFGDELEFLWEKYSGFGVFRNPDSKKWYGLIADIDKSKLEKDNVVERIKKGVYKKLAKAV